MHKLRVITGLRGGRAGGTMKTSGGGRGGVGVQNKARNVHIIRER